jgi:L-lactate dehydrogenase complex protein LldG
MKRRLMEARDEILARLDSGRRAAETPPPWQSRRAYADLTTQFAVALTAALGEVHTPATLEAALSLLPTLLPEKQNGIMIVNADSPVPAEKIRLLLPGWRIWAVAEIPSDELEAVCAVADVGLGGAEAGLAETGSVLIQTGPGRSRLASLLPPMHVALLPAAKLTADLMTWTATRAVEPGGLPANIVLISGPSKSADIAQTLTVGVHGPGRFVAIVYG